VATLNRVWNRPLPSSSAKPSAPSSVQFVESNILVGREQNTQFDLVQITVEISVLSTIKFTAPSPSPPHLHFANAVYDSPRNILWIAPFSRGTLFGFRYALKGSQPIRVSENPTVVAFDKVAEYPLEPVLGLVLSPKPVSEDAELFFATPGGFSMVHVEKSVCETLSSSSAAPASPSDSGHSLPMGSKQPSTQPANVPKPANEAKKEQVEPVRKVVKSTTTPSRSKVASPAAVNAELASEGELEAKDASKSVAEEDIHKLLKRVCAH
jgi:hypothetical protein